MRIVFMGTPNFAKNIMQALVESKKYDVVAVYTKEDAIRGRGKNLVASPVKEYSLSQEIPVFTPKKFSSDDIETLNEFQPDFICVAAYGLFLPKEILEIPKACLNVHGSLLPKWRGAAPVQRAILAGDEKTGTSIMKMDQGMDTGDYCIQSEVQIEDKSFNQIFDELAQAGSKDLMYALDNFDSLNWQAQTEANVTYANKLEKRELWLKNNDTPIQAFRKIQASSDEAPAKCCIAGRNVTVLDASINAGQLKIWKLKPDGKSEMSWDAFVAGVQEKSPENLKWKEIE